MPSNKEELSLQIFLDRASVEIYINGGEVYLPLINNAMTFNPKEYSISTSGNIEFNKFEVYKLKSIWK